MSGTGGRCDQRGVGRPRSEATRQAILAAAYEILVGEGLGAFSIEAVAARAGVARTTIYRWWASKGLLAIEAFLEGVRPQVTCGLTHSPANDLRTMLQAVARLMSGPPGRVVASIIAAAQSDPDTQRSFYEHYSLPLRRQTVRMIEAGIASGQLRADLDPGALLDAAIGGLYFRLLFGRPLDPEQVDAMADALIRGALARPEQAAADRCMAAMATPD